MATGNLPQKLSANEALELALDSLPALNTTEVVERTLSRILNATTPDEIFADPESQGLANWSGKVITINGLAGCLPSTKKGALSRYIVLECTDPETGERFAATSGGIFVVAAALRAAEQDLFPLTVRVVDLESASNPGQSSLWLVKA